MDPENPIVKLCAQGMQAEFQGRIDEARRLFTQAWETHTSPLEACIAAHYLARHQPTPEDSLHWNQEALNQAAAAPMEDVGGFYPSLYLNMGYSYEMLANGAEALRYYDQAAGAADALAQDAYGETVKNGIAEGRKRAIALLSAK